MGFFHLVFWGKHRYSVVFELLFYVHGKQLRSCHDGQLPKPDYSWAGLELLSG